MQRLEVSGAVRPIYASLGVKRLIKAQVNQDHKGSNPIANQSINQSINQSQVWQESLGQGTKKMDYLEDLDTDRKIPR